MMMIERALVERALQALETNQYAVANQAPHGDVMAYNAAVDGLRASLAKGPNIPPEASTEAEKVAYAADWWAAVTQAAVQDAVIAGVGIMRGGKRIDPASVFSLCCPTPSSCRAHCCSGDCIPRADAEAKP